MVCLRYGRPTPGYKQAVSHASCFITYLSGAQSQTPKMKYLLLLTLFIPVALFPQQISHYDSLYNAGLINHTDYMILRQTYAKPHDSTTIKLNKYDSLYKAKQITEDEYRVLKKNLFETASIPTSIKVYDPAEDRRLARGNTIGGSVFMILATGLTGGFVAAAVNGGNKPAIAVLGIFGFGFTGTGIGLLARGGTLRARADRYDRDRQLLGK